MPYTTDSIVSVERREGLVVMKLTEPGKADAGLSATGSIGPAIREFVFTEAGWEKLIASDRGVREP